VGNQVDTVGILPAFSIASVRTTASTKEINESTYEAVATTTVSGVKLLGGLLDIDQITSEVTASVTNGKPKATANKVVVSGATAAGVPIGITEKGIVGLGSSAVALAPIIDSLVQPLLDQGISVRTTPVDISTTATTATVSGGALEIRIPLAVQGYPGTFALTLGRATAELEVGATPADGSTPGGDGGAALGGDGGSFLPGLGSSSGADLPGLPDSAPSVTPGGRAPGTEIISVPVGRTIEDWDVTTLYRVLLLGGIALFAAGQVIVRSTIRPTRRSNDLRQLWRW
jgi:hypothetical protein